jgi:16S rRNA (uracil1498-N3)-methyltransferase
MAGLRSFHPSIPSPGARFTLSEAESHHLVKVRRARINDPVEVINASGQRAATRLVRADAKAAEVQVENLSSEPLHPWHLTLAQALPKGKTMDSVVQRVTELGVDRIIPLFTQQSEVDLDAKRSDQKVSKWQQTALEAAKQCGNPWLPEISAPCPLAELIPQFSSWDLVLVAALTPETRTLRKVLATESNEATASLRKILLLVGPEGDFSKEEYAAIFAAKAVPVTLGPRVLRVETASTVLAALVLAELRAQADSLF